MFLQGLVALLLLLNVSCLQTRSSSADKIDEQILEIENFLDPDNQNERDPSRDAKAWKNLGKSAPSQKATCD